MTEVRVAAIVRFGRREHLEQLLEGKIRWVPPEYYRMRYEHPTGDLDESCSASYRRVRASWKPVLTVDGHEIPADDMISLTLRGKGHPDRYLHCWSIIALPEDPDQLACLKDDLTRIRLEFGCDYLSMPHTNIEEYLVRIALKSPGEVSASIVRYTGRREEWGPACKDLQFKYQREFRFLSGKCEERDEMPIITPVGDLSDLMSINSLLQLQYAGDTILELSSVGFR